MNRRVVVVGGGLAGSAAALTCADAGARVTLLEARRRLGGATYSFQRDGLWLDNGQHVHLRCCTAYRAFIDRIGASGMVTMQRRLEIPVIHPGRGVAWIKRANLPAPLHLARSLGAYRHLSLVERLQLGRALLGLMRLDLQDASLDARTFGDWLRARGQSDGSLEALWDLIVLPTVNLPSAEASLSLAAMVFKVGLLRDRSAADMGYTTTTLGRAHSDQGLRALQAAGVDVQLGVAVSGMEVEPGGRAARPTARRRPGGRRHRAGGAAPASRAPGADRRRSGRGALRRLGCRAHRESARDLRPAGHAIFVRGRGRDAGAMGV